MTRWDVTALGEGGLRLSTPAGIPFERANSLDIAIAGAEANVTASLAALGWRSGWASILPDSPQGRRVERELRACGVATDLIYHTPRGRVGVYYVEYGAPPRPTQVHFDRRDTAFSAITSAEVHWDELLDTRLLHLTGITAAVSETAYHVIEEAAHRANDAGVLVSFDVNYRAKMWELEKARPRLAELIKAADIVFIRRADAKLLFGSTSAHEALADVRKHSSARYIVVTDGANGSTALIGNQYFTSRAVDVEIVDRLGSGDSFAAGFLHRLLDGHPTDALSYASLLAALCLSQRGEQVITTRSNIEEMLSNPGIGLDR